jgi:hypothetical protein
MTYLELVKEMVSAINKLNGNTGLKLIKPYPIKVQPKGIGIIKGWVDLCLMNNIGKIIVKNIRIDYVLSETSEEDIIEECAKLMFAFILRNSLYETYPYSAYQFKNGKVEELVANEKGIYELIK